MLARTRPCAQRPWLLHAPQPTPDVVPQPGRHETPVVPEPGPDVIPPEIIEPPPSEQPPVGEPGPPEPVRKMTPVHGGRPWLA